MVIRVLDHVSACNTAIEGAVIAGKLRSALAEHETVKLSFGGVSDVPSSFVNAAIVSLLGEMTEENLKRRLVVTEVTLQIASMIRRCVDNGTRGRAA
jgi:hypothetical protein